MPKTDYGYAQLGVDYSVPPHEQPVGMLSDAKNIVVNASGLITGRSGQVKMNSTSVANRITSVFEHRDGAATRNQLASYGTVISLYNSATGEFVEKNTGLTSNKMMQWANFGGYAISVNEGSDAPQYFLSTSSSGALSALGDTPPVGKTVADWNNRLWFGGDASNPAQLTGSKLNDLTDWTAAGSTGYVSEAVGDSGDPITGIFGFYEWLLVGKKNNLYKVYFSTPRDASTTVIDPIFSKTTDNIGFTSPWAIAQVGKDVLFLDGFDIKSIRGVDAFGDVESSSVIPHFRDYLRDVADVDYIQYTHFFHYKKIKQIWVSIPTGASTHYVFVLDYQFIEQTGRYSLFPMGEIVASCFGAVENGSADDIYYGDETGYVRQLDAGDNDDGSAIERYAVQTMSGNREGVMTFHERRSQYNHIEAFIRATASALTMTPSYATDLMDDEQVRDSSNYTALSSELVSGWSGDGVKAKRIRLFGINGRTFSLKWTHDKVAENFISYPSNVNFTPKTITQIV